MSDVDKEALLTEARSWREDETINWRDIATKYGVTAVNGGQSVKEFLQDHNIPVALKEQQENRTARRKRKTLPEGIPFPMERPSTFHKKRLIDQLETGEISQGIPVVPTTIQSFRFSKEQSSVKEIISTVHARKIPLTDIRRRLLEKHEKLGLIRICTRVEDEELRSTLENLDKSVKVGKGQANLRKHLQDITTTRYLKVWHDHSTIAGHGHFLVLVSVVYDPAFYLTTEEVREKLGRDIDVQSTVEAPEVHILGRSSSSLEDQALFNACRRDCLLQLSTPLHLNTGTEVHDTLRFFHGDGPAQQFEAGNTVGGDFCCVSRSTKSNRMDDIAYSFRSEKRSLEERQAFLLKGCAWKHLEERALDKLCLPQLQKELQLRGLATTGKKKPALEKQFKELRGGINSFPALLQDHPESSLSSINLERYEVSPTEPLHDLKGHLSNVIDETFAITSGTVRKELLIDET